VFLEDVWRRGGLSGEFPVIREFAIFHSPPEFQNSSNGFNIIISLKPEDVIYYLGSY
jgi:hypothetical protein